MGNTKDEITNHIKSTLESGTVDQKDALFKKLNKLMEDVNSLPEIPEKVELKHNIKEFVAQVLRFAVFCVVTASFPPAVFGGVLGGVLGGIFGGHLGSEVDEINAKKERGIQLDPEESSVKKMAGRAATKTVDSLRIFSKPEHSPQVQKSKESAAELKQALTHHEEKHRSRTKGK